MVMDNLTSHKSREAVRVIESVGAKAIYLPPYSPDLNPIENLFSKVKRLIRRLKPRRLCEIIESVRQSLAQITLADLEAVFEHAGYIENELS